MTIPRDGEIGFAVWAASLGSKAVKEKTRVLDLSV
jgi:hypothetical protein